MKKIIIVVIILVIAAGGAYFYFNQNGDNPAGFIQEYTQKINEENYSGMYEMLSADSKSKTSEEDFITRNKNIYSGIDMSNMQISVNEVQSESSKKTEVTYTTKMNTSGGEISFENTANLVRENDGKFKLEWSSNLIFPNLNDTDKVKVASDNANRGSIIDRNGIALAVNRKSIICRNSSRKIRRKQNTKY